MKLKKWSIVIILIIFLLMLFAKNYVLAKEKTKETKEIEFSQRFLDWLELDEEKKENSIMPRMYNIYSQKKEITNPIKFTRMLRSTFEPEFNLKTYIKENLIIKNQGSLGSCWAFASLGALETNLALYDYYNSNPVVVYDFSERHMEYATTDKFKNGVINEKGFHRNIGDGGINQIALAYLTNGTGPIEEEEMPYTDEAYLIDISEIQNKTVTGQIIDTVEFATPETADIEEIQASMKDFIKIYGGIDASIHEAENEEDGCLNNEVGAIYCDNDEEHVANHAVLIVGWNDNYSKENFAEEKRPQNNGAWIIRDSHGTDIDRSCTYDEFRQILFDAYKDELEELGITSPSQITDEEVEENAELGGFGTKDGYVYIKHNDNGYLYVSYEDVNIYSTLMGIQKASKSVEYENIYQYDEYSTLIALPSENSKMYLANIFDKSTNSTEYITQVAITTVEDVTCKVYVNPNGISKDAKDLQLVQLEAGEQENLSAGYHTLEFAKPIKIEATNFVVVVEMQGKETLDLAIPVECNVSDFIEKALGEELEDGNPLKCFENVKIANEKCFWANEQDFNKNNWEALSKLEEMYGEGVVPNCDSTIKAFTTSQYIDVSLKDIEIVTEPNKTIYTEGENFDTTGMVVQANYNNGEYETLDDTDYSVADGTNLKVGQTSVTITYEDKSVNQPITVSAKQQIPEEKAENTDFGAANGKVQKLALYMYSDSNKKEYILMETEISELKRSSTNDEVKYYYYVSSKASETNITKWVEITEKQTLNDKLCFIVDTRKISNVYQLLSAEDIYIYIKEVAIKGKNESVKVSNAIKLEADKDCQVELYSNDVIVAQENVSGSGTTGSNSSASNQATNKTEENKPTSLPYTGNSIKFIAILVIIVIGFYVYIKYRKLKDI